MKNANDNAGKPASPERRNLISALAGGAALSILSGQAMAAQALAGIPSNSKLAPGKGVLSWDEYGTTFFALPASWSSACGNRPSDTQRIELYRQFLMNISMGYFLYFQADYNHPDWMPFMNSVYLAQPNPDDVYLMSRIRGTGTYRISGNRGTVPHPQRIDRQEPDRHPGRTGPRLQQLRFRQAGHQPGRQLRGHPQHRAAPGLHRQLATCTPRPNSSWPASVPTTGATSGKPGWRSNGSMPRSSSRA